MCLCSKEVKSESQSFIDIQEQKIIQSLNFRIGKSLPLSSCSSFFFAHLFVSVLGKKIICGSGRIPADQVKERGLSMCHVLWLTFSLILWNLRDPGGK